MSNFCTGLDLDKESLLGKVVLIIEESNCDANFAITSLLWKVMNPKVGNNAVLLLAMHHPLNHYNIVSVKLGFNIKSLQQKGRLIVINEPNKLLPNCNLSCSNSVVDVPGLFEVLRSKIEELKKNHDNVYVFIDDITDLLYLQVGPSMIFMLTHYLRTLLVKEVGIVLLCHCSDFDNEQVRLRRSFHHVSDIVLTIRNLKTGVSKEVTGSIEKTQRLKSNEWTKRDLYHYKVTDRTIRVFAPGNI